MKSTTPIPSFSTKKLCFYSGEYSYGFNGKELDSEGMGGGASTYDYGFRIYNSALGRFLSVDPLSAGYPWFSLYQFAGNSPIVNLDLDGCEPFYYMNGMQMLNPPIGAGTVWNEQFRQSMKVYTAEEIKAEIKSLRSQAQQMRALKVNSNNVLQIPSPDTQEAARQLEARAEDMECNLTTGVCSQDGVTPLEVDNLAVQIKNNSNITLGKFHPAPEPGYSNDDEANANDNINDMANNQPASTSPYSDVGRKKVIIAKPVMKGMIELAKKYEFTVTEICGGDHGDDSRHYIGLAFDVNTINGAPVNLNNKFYKQFMKEAKALGATQVLGPGDPKHSGHVHIAWPRSMEEK